MKINYQIHFLYSFFAKTRIKKQKNNKQAINFHNYDQR